MMCTLKTQISNKLFSSWNQPKCEFLELLLGLQQPSLQTFITYTYTEWYLQPPAIFERHKFKLQNQLVCK